jgi:hypothetical protein
MSLTINNSHPTFTLETKVSEICKPFFDQYNFNYFQYARLFSDGSIACLLSDASLFKHLMDLDLTSFSSVKPQQSYWFLWDEELPEFPVKLAKEAHNLHHGLTLLRRKKTHYDMIAVAMPIYLGNSASFYLNHLKIIESFICDFETKHQELLDLVFNNCIELPKKNWDPNLKKIILPSNSIFIPKINNHITMQELSCLRLLAKGLSYKEIGQTLSISPRSVETYLHRLKDRTQYKTKLDLHYLLLICP